MSRRNTLQRFWPAAIFRAPRRAEPRSIRRGQQKQEQCPVSLVFGGESAAFRTLHDNLPFGRAHAPPPGPASLLQDRFENRKLIGHCNRFNGSSRVPYLCLSISSQVQRFTARETKTQQDRQCLNRIYVLVERWRASSVQTWAGSLEILGSPQDCE